MVADSSGNLRVGFGYGRTSGSSQGHTNGKAQSGYSETESHHVPQIYGNTTGQLPSGYAPVGYFALDFLTVREYLDLEGRVNSDLEQCGFVQQLWKCKKGTELPASS